MEIEFKIFTLNCWGIPVVSKDIKPRMQSIAEHLVATSYDMVCLQEVWTESDYNLVRDKVRGSYPYSHYFYSGVIGSGVCVFSKHLLQDVFFHQWPVNGYIHKFQHGDWFAGKGIAMCRVVVGGYNINIYTSHLLAEYNRICDEYETHRMIQAYDTAQFIQLTSAAADLAILAGDLNTEPGDLPHKVLMSVTGFNDAYIEAESEAQEPFYTNDGPHNTYTAPSLLKKNYPGKRIDYILYNCGSNTSVEMKKYCRPLPNRVPGCEYSYSDHEAITATLLLKKSEGLPKTCDVSSRATVLTECIDMCNIALNTLLNHKRVYWFLTALLSLILITTVAMDSLFGKAILIHIVRVVVTILLGFTFIMATAWNRIERHAVIAGKLAMEVTLKQYVDNGKREF
ncbi:hypothetical protein FQR65_LT04902 [Abscondita terminalis]|nr:hypothetical protein FQR65_LT04902 [Abscondita terminalis]